jgi:hypothetical protein
MSAAPAILVACCVVGSVCGAASGFLHGGLAHAVPLAVAGALLGFVLGVASFLALMAPYGWLLGRYAKPRPEARVAGPPRVLAYLALPVMAAALVLAAAVSWFAVGLFG